VNRDEFESKILELWMKSRIPLTTANLQYFAGVSRQTVNSWIDESLEQGLLDIDLGEYEDVTYVVRGAERSPDGPTTCEEYERKRALVQEAKERILARRNGVPRKEPTNAGRKVKKAKTRKAATEANDAEDQENSEKDDGTLARDIAGVMGKAALIASTTALVTLDKPLAMLDAPRSEGEKSLLASAGLSLLGPVGWLYAGSFREAVPATLAQVAILTVVPSFLLAPFLVLGALASSAVGLGYAWKFNRKKGRSPLFLTSKKKDKKTD